MLSCLTSAALVVIEVFLMREPARVGAHLKPTRAVWVEIPRLYIAKQFKRFVAEREWRVAAYIERVADDDAHAPEDEGIEGATGAEAGAGHRGSVAEPPPDGRRTTRSRPTRLVA